MARAREGKRPQLLSGSQAVSIETLLPGPTPHSATHPAVQTILLQDPYIRIGMANRDIATRLRERVWDASIPLEIRLHKADSSSYDSEPYLAR